MRIELGGPENRRAFETFSQGTLEHDHFVTTRLRAAGLRDLHIRDDESGDDFAERLLDELLSDGGEIGAEERRSRRRATYELIGAWLVPEGILPLNWTPEIAAETGEFLRTLTDEDSKKAIHYRTAELLMDFIARGIVSLRRSGLSSGKDRPALRDSEAERSTLSETGVSLSAR